MEFAVIGAGIAIIGFCYYQNNIIQKSRFQVELGVEKEIKIIQLSDLHSKIFIRKNKGFIKQIEREKPDLIFATGDMIDSNLKNKEKIIEFLGGLTKICKVIYIPGNNEMRCLALNEILEGLKERDVIVLRNEFYTINIKGEKINILGMAERLKRSKSIPKVSDTYHYNGWENLLERLEKLNGIKIILSHYPENFFHREGFKGYKKYDFDLMFSGHAHGGQFRIPFVGGVFAPGQGLFPKYTEGIHENRLIISRGLGNSGFPLRLFNRPNIVVVEIN